MAAIDLDSPIVAAVETEMTSEEIRSELSRFRNIHWGFFQVMSPFLSELDTQFRSLVTGVVTLLQTNTSTNEFTEILNGQKQTIRDADSKIRTQSPRAIMQALAEMQKYLQERDRTYYGDRTNKDGIGLFLNYQTTLENFAKAYEEFLVSASLRSTVELLLVGQRLRAKSATVEAAIAIPSRLWADRPFSKPEETFTLQLSSTLTAVEFSRKLTAITTIYEEICSLLSISTASNPLKIGEIESGSLWVRLFGESKVIALMVQFVEGTAHFFYRNYTKEGKIASLPKKLESIDAILGLKQRLEESGIDTSELTDHIQKSSVALGAQLETLLAGEPKIRVNSIEITVGGDVLDQATLTGPVPKLLTDDTAPASG